MKKKSILYNIYIPQDKLRKIAPKLSSDAAIILDFISRWQLWSREKSKKANIKGKEYIWLHYPTLIEALPILRIRSKARITRRIEELIKYNLLEREKLRDNTLYVRITDKAASLYIPEDLATKSIQPGNIVAPDLDTPRDQHNTIINNTKGVPAIKEVIDFFFETCQNIKGFKPRISGAIEGKMIKNYLKDYSKEDLTDELSWFLGSKESEDLGCTIKVALSAFVFNKWLAQRETYHP